MHDRSSDDGGRRAECRQRGQQGSVRRVGAPKLLSLSAAAAGSKGWRRDRRSHAPTMCRSASRRRRRFLVMDRGDRRRAVAFSESGVPCSLAPLREFKAAPSRSLTPACPSPVREQWRTAYVARSQQPQQDAQLEWVQPLPARASSFRSNAPGTLGQLWPLLLSPPL